MLPEISGLASWSNHGELGALAAPKSQLIEAFQAEPETSNVRCSTVEVYEQITPPVGAVVYYQGVDPVVGAMTKYAMRYA